MIVLPSISSGVISSSFFDPKKISGLALWLKADTGVTLGTYVSQIALTCTGGLSSYSGTYIATSAPDIDGAYSLFCSANSKTIYKDGFGSGFTIGPDFPLAVSADGISWNIVNVLVAGLTISGATGSYTGANGTYELNERTEDSGDIYRSNENGYYGLVNTSGAVEIFGPDYSLLYYNTSFGSGAWGNENGTGDVTASSIQLDPSGTVSGSITTSPISIVTAWADQSGNGRNPNPEEGSNIVSLVEIEGKSFVSFTNSNLLIPTIWNSVPVIGTIFTVARFNSSSTESYGSRIFFQNADANVQLTRGYEGTNNFYFQSFGDLVLSSVPVNNNTNYIIGTTFNSSSISLFLNGASVGTGSTEENYSYDGPNIGAGEAYKIAEIVVYNRVLTTPERQQVEAYLNSKYAIY